MNANTISNVVAFPRISDEQPGVSPPESAYPLTVLRKDCAAALAQIAGAVEDLMGKVDDFAERLKTAPPDETRDLLLARLQDVRDRLEATRLRSQLDARSPEQAP
jgi:hypothetical protein